MQLEQWLNSRNKPYDVGLKLFEELGGSAALLSLFRSSESSYNRNKLAEKLQEIFETIPAESKKTPALPKTVTTPLSSAQSKQFHPDLTPIYDLKLSSFKKMAAIHQQLSSITGNGPKAVESRYKLQKEILQLDELNEQCWDKIHYFEKHGKLPVDESGFYPDQLTIRELVNLEKAIPSYITKLAKDAENMELPEEKRQELFNRKAEWHLKAQRIRAEIDAFPELRKVKEALCS